MKPFDKSSAFRPKTKEEIVAEQKDKEKVQELQAAVKEQATALFADERYKILREVMESHRIALVNLFIRVDAPTPIEEWKQFKQIQADMHVLNSVLGRFEIIGR